MFKGEWIGIERVVGGFPEGRGVGENVPEEVGCFMFQYVARPFHSQKEL